MSIQIQISSLIELSEKMLIAAQRAEWLHVSEMDEERRRQVLGLEAGEPSTQPVGLSEKLQVLKDLDEDIRELVDQARGESGEQYHSLKKEQSGLSMYHGKMTGT